MKHLLLVIGSLLSVATAQALSLHPCTPRVQAMDSQLNCRDLNNSYSITIHTMMSPAIPMCSGENHQEVHTADIEVRSLSTGKVVDEFSILENNDIAYRLGTVQDGFFRSEANGLNLEGCVSPAHGGLSIGN